MGMRGYGFMGSDGRGENGQEGIRNGIEEVPNLVPLTLVS